MKIYIAGPMTGIENFNKPAFYAAERFIVSKRFATEVAVLNPAKLPNGLTQAEYMDICFAMVRACDVVVFLSGWEASEGAEAEMYYAKKIGKQLYFDLDLRFNKW